MKLKYQIKENVNDTISLNEQKRPEAICFRKNIPRKELHQKRVKTNHIKLGVK